MSAFAISRVPALSLPESVPYDDTAAPTTHAFIPISFCTSASLWRGVRCGRLPTGDEDPFQ